MSSSPSYLDPIVLSLIVGKTVLDVGCGYGRWGILLQTNFWGSGLKEPPEIDGFDAFQPNVELCSNRNCYRELWQQVMPSPLANKWDTVLACEFIEHIAQDKVEEVFDILEKVAKKRVIFSTPNWAYYRKGSETIGGWNDFEAHLSYISRDYFVKRGYRIIGAGFANPTNKLACLINKLCFFISPALESLPRIIPAFGQLIVAFKDIK